MSPAPIPRGSSGLLSLGPTWRIRSENKRRKWDTGRFPGSPLPSVLQINNPRLQRPPPRSSPLLNRRLHGLPARPAPGQRPRPRDPPPASSRGYGPSRGLLFCYGKSESPRGVGWRAGKAGGGDLKPLRYSDWSSRRKGAWPLLTMRCKDPTTFQSPRPRPRATPRLLGCRLLVLSATPPSQLLKMPLQRFVSLFGAQVFVLLYLTREGSMVLLYKTWANGEANPGFESITAFPAWNPAPYIRLLLINLERSVKGTELGPQSVRNGIDLWTG